MKWSHLPMEGGLFNQDPLLLERFQHIFAEQADEDRRQEAKREAERNQSMGSRRPNKVHRP